MMKHIIIMTAVLIASISVFGQTNQYHKFLSEGAGWRELFISYTFEYDSITYIQPEATYGDTIIDGKLYVVMNSIFIREDTINRKIYVREHGIDLPDTLLYDFNLNIGESAAHCAEFSVGNLFPDATVIDIDSILIGTYRKRWEIKYTPLVTYGDSITYWIEGVGSDNGIFSPYSSWYWPDIRRLACYSEFGTILYSDLQYWYDCDEVFEDTTDNIYEQHLRAEFEIRPNPASLFTTVYLPDNQTNNVKQISVVNIDGRPVLNDTFIDNQLNINCSNFTPGVYIVMISNDEWISYSKLLVTH